MRSKIEATLEALHDTPKTTIFYTHVFMRARLYPLHHKSKTLGVGY
ncbi:MAG TPA: hypothetical protein PKN57_10725 [Saprospiraceae bacterium]|nr:hypothetical protein [Saprospiraceae bacterium]MCC6689277.1 hypothetical protein [Saprospiraceae bacterium]HMV23405.1 hypothetical protein [Saprospiraceae bacterium]HMW75028.1 hypothetical protein [Saprospiraceae bacterium]HMX81891.1 hypothetical protein [Saprospiraceae bacterium]